jgi:type 1 fimbria pilin
MKKSIIAAGAIAFVAASLSAIAPAGAIVFWGPTTPTQINNYLDTSTTIVGDFAQVRAGVFGGAVTGPSTTRARAPSSTRRRLTARMGHRMRSS